MKEILLLGLDVETTGLDPETCEITEVGAVLWHWQQHRGIAYLGEILRVDQALEPKVEKLTGLTNKLLVDHGQPRADVFTRLENLMARADYLVAHNAPFDKSFLVKCCPSASTRPWIDTRTDIPFPDGMESRKLVHLATDHGFINPFPHQAVTDVLTMLRLLSGYDIDRVIYRSTCPNVTLHAAFQWSDSRLFQEKKAKAKEMGYHWKPDFKQWRKDVKECDKNEVIHHDSQHFPVYEVTLAR
jgi:DNA polymerase-3 subunit epsilon